LKIKFDLQKLLDISFTAYKFKVIPIQQECILYIATLILNYSTTRRLHTPVTSLQENQETPPQYLLNRRLVGCWDSVHVWRGEKFLVPAENETMIPWLSIP